MNTSNITAWGRQIFPKAIIVICSLFAGTVIGYIGKNPLQKAINYIPFDDTRIEKWDSPFELISIYSTVDQKEQKLYAYKSTAESPQPLVVSLHSWSGNYAQNDLFRDKVVERNWNYIHPDFRGANNNPEACVSDLVLYDLDDAIDYALENFNCDTERIYIIGGSGGAYASIASLLKSKHNIKEYSVWNPISDIHAWYYQSKVRELKYADDILLSTGSLNGELNVEEALARSPLYWPVSAEKISNTTVKLYAGIYDGLLGAVPFTHSINFYNKLLSDLECSDSSMYVTEAEKALLMENAPMLKDFGMLGDRKILFQKKYKNIELLLFEGRHEILTDIVMDTLD